MIEDESFAWSEGLERAVDLLNERLASSERLPGALPETGLGEFTVLEQLAPRVVGQAEPLDAATALAHMDPPTPWITWAMALWNARLNQNLLHPATAPFALGAEQQVIDWLAPFYGMNGGHFCSGSTLCNLTGIWAARDAAGAKTLVASEASHLSVRKSARLLGMDYRSVGVDEHGRIRRNELGELKEACLVLTAGATNTGAVDELDADYGACWTHVDAAWAGPLCLSQRYRHLLEGIGRHDSVCISAHKWFFQPKDSGLILFRNVDRANGAISLDGSYLTTPNIGVQGSRGANAIPLLATLLACGRNGMAEWIERSMRLSEELYRRLHADARFETWNPPQTGVNLFRPAAGPVQELLDRLPPGMLSVTELAGNSWIRSVAANPLADIDRIVGTLALAADGNAGR